ncbi:KGK domain-containing protein [Nostoc sp. ChiVER01]|uniref:KGK domain-containing protein n=1 Tax=Nostoc sp. ChiVER01 TaxID=3075382 RepID=UPI002AD2EB58|nr:KGK domain-containing protein [Nostoc sp. ChiVER01]MDZ8227544.1 KGK domain-containing protein [Nostoc sp. ChiVER01]
MNNEIILNDEDVVSMAQEANFAEASTSTLEELMAAINEALCNYSRQEADTVKNWVTQGVECKVLQAKGGGWQKGKVKICLEFTPNISTSPLDDLRNNS